MARVKKPDPDLREQQRMYKRVADALLNELRDKYPELWAALDSDDVLLWRDTIIKRCWSSGTAIAIERVRRVWGRTAVIKWANDPQRYPSRYGPEPLDGQRGGRPHDWNL